MLPGALDAGLGPGLSSRADAPADLHEVSPLVIVIGVAPGLKSSAYSVLDVSGSAAVDIDKDILSGGRFKGGLVDLSKKAYVHYLILSVVFERDPPALLVIGPPCNPKEQTEHFDAAVLMLRRLAEQTQVSWVQVVTQTQIQEVLTPGPRESLSRVVSRRMSRPFCCDDRAIVLAAAIALTGAALHARTQGEK